MHQETQIWKHKPQPTITYTCQHKDCVMGWQTLNQEQWLTAKPEEYRLNQKAVTQ
jgi:hypothetical protein